MNVGALRHRVTPQEFVVEQDSDGAVIETWVNPFNHDVWADIQPLSGKELLASQSFQSEVTARIIVRYKAEYNAKMRILHKNKIYNIKAVIPDADTGNRHLTLLCGEGLNEG